MTKINAQRVRRHIMRGWMKWLPIPVLWFSVLFADAWLNVERVSNDYQYEEMGREHAQALESLHRVRVEQVRMEAELDRQAVALGLADLSPGQELAMNYVPEVYTGPVVNPIVLARRLAEQSQALEDIRVAEAAKAAEAAAAAAPPPAPEALPVSEPVATPDSAPPVVAEAASMAPTMEQVVASAVTQAAGVVEAAAPGVSAPPTIPLPGRTPRPATGDVVVSPALGEPAALPLPAPLPDLEAAPPATRRVEVAAEAPSPDESLDSLLSSL